MRLNKNGSGQRRRIITPSLGDKGGMVIRMKRRRIKPLSFRAKGVTQLRENVARRSSNINCTAKRFGIDLGISEQIVELRKRTLRFRITHRR